MNAINPYACVSERFYTDDQKSSSSALLTIVGTLLCTLATAGALFRFTQIPMTASREWVTIFEWLGVGAPLAGLCVFAVASLLLMNHFATSHNMKRADLRLCQVFIVIAAAAMLTRALFEPNTVWIPRWPAYSLTLSAAVALLMVWRQYRKSASFAVK